MHIVDYNPYMGCGKMTRGRKEAWWAEGSIPKQLRMDGGGVHAVLQCAHDNNINCIKMLCKANKDVY